MSGITQEANNRIVEISRYVKAEFSRDGVRIFSVVKPPDGSIYLFAFELGTIVQEYRKWKEQR